MSDSNKKHSNIDILMRDLRERRKELDCLYQLEELLKKMTLPKMIFLKE